MIAVLIAVLLWRRKLHLLCQTSVSQVPHLKPGYTDAGHSRLLRKRTLMAAAIGLAFMFRRIGP